MALSNILIEPRREFTETGMGITAFILFLIPPVIIQGYFPMYGNSPGDMPYLIGLLLWSLIYLATIAIGSFLGYITLILIHTVGEITCNLLEGIGIHLRPRQRYRRNWNNKIVKDY